MGAHDPGRQAVVGIYPGAQRTGVAAVAAGTLLAGQVLDRGRTPDGSSWYDADANFAAEVASLADDVADHVGAEVLAIGASADSGAASQVQRAAVLGALRVMAQATGRRLVVLQFGPRAGLSPAAIVGCQPTRPEGLVLAAAYDVARAAAGTTGSPRRWTPRIIQGARA